MKTLQDTPTAELLAEWGKLAAIAKHTNYARDATFDKVAFEGKITAIAAELDRRCSEAGIVLIDGVFQYSLSVLMQTRYEHVSWLSVSAKTAKHLSPTPMPAEEQHALEAWLLTKGGNG